MIGDVIEFCVKGGVHLNKRKFERVIRGVNNYVWNCWIYRKRTGSTYFIRWTVQVRVAKGLDVDKPRNLAKSVTVE